MVSTYVSPLMICTLCSSQTRFISFIAVIFMASQKQQRMLAEVGTTQTGLTTLWLN